MAQEFPVAICEPPAGLPADADWTRSPARRERGAAPPLPEAPALAARRSAARVAASHRVVWDGKPILREIYRDFFSRMSRCLAPVGGPTIELGSGPGTTKMFLPNLWSSDVAAVPWLDFVADACTLPLADASVGNLVLVDVLHHLAYPRRFLSEAGRVLKPGGRLVILDVFLGPGSYALFRFLHPEPATLSIRPLDHPEAEPLFDTRDPWNSDQGIARAIFWEQRSRFLELFPGLKIIHRECFSPLVWPLSGGFEQKNRVPAFAAGLLWKIDRALERWGRYVGFRCLVALQRSGDGDESTSRRGVD